LAPVTDIAKRDSGASPESLVARNGHFWPILLKNSCWSYIDEIIAAC
jgi:hypothetical protein